MPKKKPQTPEKAPKQNPKPAKTPELSANDKEKKPAIERIFTKEEVLSGFPDHAQNDKDVIALMDSLGGKGTAKKILEAVRKAQTEQGIGLFEGWLLANASLELFKALIDAGADPNAMLKKMGQGKMLAQVLLDEQNFDKLDYLVLKKVDLTRIVDAEGELLWTNEATNLQSTAGLEYLLKNGLNPNLKNAAHEGITPIFLAGLSGNEKGVELLLKFKADPLITNDLGETPLEMLMNMYPSVFKKYLREKVYLEMHDEIKNGRIDPMDAMIIRMNKGLISTKPIEVHNQEAHQTFIRIIKIFFSNGESPQKRNSKGNSLYQLLLELGPKQETLPLLKFFLEECGADINETGEDGISLVHVAVAEKTPELLSMCLKKGLDINAKTNRGTTPLMMAALENNPMMLFFLLDHGANLNEVDSEGKNALHYAAIKGKIETAQFLMNKGLSVNSKTHQSWTPLHLAVNSTEPKMVNLLLDAGADHTIKAKLNYSVTDEKGNILRKMTLEPTPFEIALSQNAGEIETQEQYAQIRAILMSFLEKRDIDINLANPLSWTALHFAALFNDEELVRFCIKKGANVNVQDHKQWTPLHLAYNNGHEAVVRILSFAGANPMLKNDKGQIPSDLDLKARTQQQKRGILEIPPSLLNGGFKIPGRGGDN